MAGRAFKGWGLLLNSFNRGFNPGSFVSGAERGIANAQRKDDIARAGAWRQQDKQEAAEAKKRAGNERMLSRVATSPEDWDAALKSGWRQGGEVDQSVLAAVREARAQQAAAAAARAQQAAKAVEERDIRKHQAEAEKARISAAPGNSNAWRRKQVALGAELLRLAGNDPQKAEAMRRRHRRYRNAILPGPDRSGVVLHAYDMDKATPLERFSGRLRATGLEGFTDEYPVVRGLLKQYTAPRPGVALRVGNDARAAIMTLRDRDSAAAQALEDIIVEMQQNGRVTVDEDASP